MDRDCEKARPVYWSFRVYGRVYGEHGQTNILEGSESGGHRLVIFLVLGWRLILIGENYIATELLIVPNSLLRKN